MIHVKDHGAVGDGITDDTAAIRAAVATGDVLEWGGPGDVYLVTDQIAVTPTAPVHWVSGGATILCGAPSPVKNVVFFDIDGHSLRIDGTLNIDANRSAFSCLYALNSGAAADARLTDLHAENAYRSSLTHTGGDGIHLRGAWRTITLDRPIVRNIAMATDAVVPDNQGITGITISAIDSQHLPGDILITAPYVDGVLSEDTTMAREQDGIRVMTANHEAGMVAPYETNVEIVGGTIRNCGGRSVKYQAEWGSVVGTKIYRDVDRAILNREIDFQKGGGHLADVTVHYAGTGAKNVVCFGDGVVAGKHVPHGSVSGIKVLNTGGDVIESLVTMRDTQGVGMKLIGRGLEVRGGAVDHLLRVDATAETVVHAIVSDAVLDCAVSAVAAWYGHPTTWGGDIILSNVINTGNPVPMLTRNTGGTATPTLHGSNMVGFTGQGATAALDLSSLISGWSEVGDGCHAYRAGHSITYTFQLRGPSRGDAFPMMRLPDGWRPSAATIVPLRTFDQSEAVGDVFVSTDGQVTAYRSESTTWWSYATVTVPA